ncbi:MAG: response regulator transcription factor [Candidatus Gastranaerophilales bacterium]|nr:response regulator transcription factor [Candidatus Gastranaerophilales bacterium]
MPDVVIADDEEFVRYFLRGLLESIFFDVIEEVSSGDALYPVISEKKPDILLLDINMPNLKGNDFLMQYKQDLSKICVIVLTVSTSSEIEAQLKAEGFTHFLRKNNTPEDITSYIQKAWSEFSKGVYNV